MLWRSSFTSRGSGGDIAATNGTGRIIRRNGWALTILAVAFGAAIIAGHIESGRARWAEVTWQYALEVPGSPFSWGAIIFIAGLFLLYGQIRGYGHASRIGCWTAFVWFCSLDAASIIAVIADILSDDRVANPLVLIVWTWFAYMYRQHQRDTTIGVSS